MLAIAIFIYNNKTIKDYIVHNLYFRSKPDITKPINKTIHHIVNEETPHKSVVENLTSE
jgi:hypothetical protein